MKAFCILESDVYGADYHDYDTVSEAREGFKRLVASARKYTAEDGITRKVTLATKIVTIEGEN